MVTIEDILEEILGEFSSDSNATDPDVHRDTAGDTWTVNASISVRALNRMTRWQLPTDGPATLNGLILETLETIPAAGTVLELDGYEIEILRTGGNAVSTVRIRPPGREAGA
ncbi:MAG: transporter associated domain-containing protein [Gammaproteobacteria bacterium]